MAKKKIAQGNIFTGVESLPEERVPGELGPAPGTENDFWPPLPTRGGAYQRAAALVLQDSFAESERWSPEKLLDHQRVQAKRLIDHAADTVPYYARQFADLPKGGTLTPAQWAAVPVLERSAVQEAGDRLLSSRIPEGHGGAIIARTSGSSGRPVQIHFTVLSNIFYNAVRLRHHLWHGYDFSQKSVDIRTAPPRGAPTKGKWSAFPNAGPRVQLDIAKPVDRLLDEVLAEDPAYLGGHPSSIYGLYEESVARGVRPANLRKVVCFGEALSDQVHDDIERYWQVPVLDMYAASETGPAAFECPEEGNLHMQCESILIEVLNEDDAPCREGEIGRMVVTPLHNFAMPLIRYAIGDYASLGPPCPCGRGLPVLAEIMGRQRNLLVYPDGRRIFPEVRAGGLDDVVPIRQFQCIQTDLDHLLFVAVPSRPWTDDDAIALRKFLHDKFGHPFEIGIEFRDEIDRGPGYKYEEFRSDVV